MPRIKTVLNIWTCLQLSQTMGPSKTMLWEVMAFQNSFSHQQPFTLPGCFTAEDQWCVITRSWWDSASPDPVPHIPPSTGFWSGQNASWCLQKPYVSTHSLCELQNEAWSQIQASSSFHQKLEVAFKCVCVAFWGLQKPLVTSKSHPDPFQGVFRFSAKIRSLLFSLGLHSEAHRGQGRVCTASAGFRKPLECSGSDITSGSRGSMAIVSHWHKPSPHTPAGNSRV